MTYCHVSHQIDRYCDEIGFADEACDWFDGSTTERLYFQKWIASNLTEVASGESIYTDLTFDTYRNSSDWEDDAVESYQTHITDW
jgi:hypothetical protein